MVGDGVAAIEKVTPDEYPHRPGHGHFGAESSHKSSRNDHCENKDGDCLASDTNGILSESQIRLVDGIAGHRLRNDVADRENCCYSEIVLSNLPSSLPKKLTAD